MDAEVELSIVMPCLNEAETLAVCLSKAQRFLERSGIQGELVVGDNGSTDGSQQIARSFGARVVDVPLRGYGAALYGAIVASRGTYCIMGDSDDSYDFEHLDGFVARLRTGCDLVMGNRFRGGIEPGAMPWKNRYIGNPVLSTIGRLLFHAPAGDFHCGLRGFRRKSLLEMDLRTTGMEFASEMVIKAQLLGMAVAEVPTTLKRDGRSRPPHLLPYRDGWRHLRFMLLFSPAWLFLYPGMLLMGMGLCVGALLETQSVQLEHIRLGLDTLIYCGALVSGGFQSVLFWILARRYALEAGLYPRVGGGRSRLERWFTLERGLVAGGALLAGGMGLAVAAVAMWQRHGFGSLEPERIARLVIPSSVALAMGWEVLLFSLLASTFALNVRPLVAMAEQMRCRADDVAEEKKAVVTGTFVGGGA